MTDSKWFYPTSLSFNLILLILNACKITFKSLSDSITIHTFLYRGCLPCDFVFNAINASQSTRFIIFPEFNNHQNTVLLTRTRTIPYGCFRFVRVADPGMEAHPDPCQ